MFGVFVFGLPAFCDYLSGLVSVDQKDLDSAGVLQFPECSFDSFLARDPFFCCVNVDPSSENVLKSYAFHCSSVLFFLPVRC